MGDVYPTPETWKLNNLGEPEITQPGRTVTVVHSLGLGGQQCCGDRLAALRCQMAFHGRVMLIFLAFRYDGLVLTMS